MNKAKIYMNNVYNNKIYKHTRKEYTYMCDPKEMELTKIYDYMYKFIEM